MLQLWVLSVVVVQLWVLSSVLLQRLVLQRLVLLLQLRVLYLMRQL